MSTARRYPTLDLLRVIAITLTILAHVTSITYTVPILREFRFGMFFGVDLFMLISGWLLGGQLLREVANGQTRPWRFYFKRWMRTLPPYYTMLIILFVTREGGFENASPADLVEHFLFIQFYVHAPGSPNLYFISWSLCVEEHFYLLLPLVIYAIRKLDRVWFVLALVMGVELIAVLFRIQAFPTDRAGIPMVTHMRTHGLFLGLFFAYLAHKQSRVWDALGRMAPWLGLAGIAGTLVVMATVGAPFNAWCFIVAPTLGTWTLAMIFIPCVHPTSSWSRFNFRGLQYLGELTYSVYLIHAVIPKGWIGAKVTTSPLQGFAIRFGLMFGCAILLHEVVEKPALRLRDWILTRWRMRDAVAST